MIDAYDESTQDLYAILEKEGEMPRQSMPAKGVVNAEATTKLETDSTH